MISIYFAAQATSNCTLQLKPDYNLQATNYSNPGIHQTYKAVNGISYTSLTFLHKPPVPTDLRLPSSWNLSDSAYVTVGAEWIQRDDYRTVNQCSKNPT